MWRKICAGWGYIVVGVIGSAMARGDDWPTYGHDNRHTLASSASFDPWQLSLVWQTPQSNQFPVRIAQPIIAGSSVYVTDFHSDSSATLDSYLLANGQLNWQTPISGVSISSPAYADGLVVFTGNQNQLVVVDAVTGNTRYTVNNAAGTFLSTGPSPVLMHDSGGNLIAYSASAGSAAATQLGATSGTVLWLQPGSLGGGAAPAVVGNAIVAAGPGQYYAYDQTTGTTNHFQTSATIGGGSSTVSYDPARKQLYIPDYGYLTAYSYQDNNHITELWSVNELNIYTSAIALDANGNIWTENEKGLFELDPATGDVLRSVPGDFVGSVVPLIQGNFIWAEGESLTAYDLTTLAPVWSLTPPEFYNYTPIAVDDSHLIVDYSITGAPESGLMVYAVPEPGIAMLALCLAAAALSRRR